MTPGREEFTPLEAVAAMREMERVDARVRARVHGLTWLFWGFVAPAIFVTFAFASTAIRGNAYGDQPSWFGALWVPWVAGGLVFTVLLRRTVGLVLPRRGPGARELVAYAALFLAATVGLVVAGAVAGVRAYPPALVLAGLGLVTAMLGVRSAFAGARAVGGAHVTAGGLLVAFAVTETLAFAGPPSYATLSTIATWNAFASALGLGGLGAFRVLRS